VKVKSGVTNEASLRTAIRSVLLEGTSYTIKRGDSLSKIAQRVYGDPHRWPDIYDANRDVLGGNPNLIHPDTVITIPDLDVDDIGFKQTIEDLIAMNPDAVGPGWI
jgi:nucleoid-associated protein YgaU